MAAAEAIDKGLSVEDIRRSLSTRSQLRAILHPGYLEYSRIGKATAFIGMLSVKPILTVRNGEIDAVERARREQGTPDPGADA